ncbi:MAG: hypothetical protein GY771_04440 [bacterium]|nr:hypothetical protein [bacterium]
MNYKIKSVSISVVIAVIVAVIGAVFLGCDGNFRHVAGEERDYDPGETGDDFIRIGSTKKPVDTQWLYQVIENDGETYETEITVIAVTDNSYKLRDRREGRPDIEYYYEYGPETDGFTAISLYEVYVVGGERITDRYSPPRKNMPADGYLKEGLSWRDSPIAVEETTMRRREKDKHDSKMAAMRYSVEAVGPVDTPAGEFTAATLVKSSVDDKVLEKSYISNIGTVKRVIYDDDGSVLVTWELSDYTFPERD